MSVATIIEPACFWGLGSRPWEFLGFRLWGFRVYLNFLKVPGTSAAGFGKPCLKPGTPHAKQQLTVQGLGGTSNPRPKS